MNIQEAIQGMTYKTARFPKEAFERILKLVSLEQDTLEFLIGDGMTCGGDMEKYLRVRNSMDQYGC